MQSQRGRLAQNVPRYEFASRDLHHLGRVITLYQSHRSLQKHRDGLARQQYLPIRPPRFHHVVLDPVHGIPSQSTGHRFQRYLLPPPTNGFGHTSRVTWDQRGRHSVSHQLPITIHGAPLLEERNHHESTRSIRSHLQ